MTNSVIFKIRNMKTGSFSTGGYYGGFNKTGKSWLTMGQLNSHLRMLDTTEIRKRYKDCEIVPYELVPQSTLTLAAHADYRDRMDRLMALHRDADFVGLLEKFYKDGTAEKYPWIVYAEFDHTKFSDYDGFKKDLRSTITKAKVKKSDLRHSGTTYAFTHKKDAAIFRLAVPGTAFAYNAVSLLETDIDTP